MALISLSYEQTKQIYLLELLPSAVPASPGPLGAVESLCSQNFNNHLLLALFMICDIKTPLFPICQNLFSDFDHFGNFPSGGRCPRWWGVVTTRRAATTRVVDGGGYLWMGRTSPPVDSDPCHRRRLTRRLGKLKIFQEEGVWVLRRIEVNDPEIFHKCD